MTAATRTEVLERHEHYVIADDLLAEADATTNVALADALVLRATAHAILATATKEVATLAVAEGNQEVA